MKKIVLIIAAGLLMSSTVFADWRYSTRDLKSTDLHTEMVRFDPDYPGAGFMVTFKVTGNASTSIGGKRWDTFFQNQLIDCSDKTYIVVDGVYYYGDEVVSSFENKVDELKWRSGIARLDTDAGKRVVEFCAW